MPNIKRIAGTERLLGQFPAEKIAAAHALQLNEGDGLRECLLNDAPWAYVLAIVQRLPTGQLKGGKAIKRVTVDQAVAKAAKKNGCANTRAFFLLFVRVHLGPLYAYLEGEKTHILLARWWQQRQSRQHGGFWAVGVQNRLTLLKLYGDPQNLTLTAKQMALKSGISTGIIKDFFGELRELFGLSAYTMHVSNILLVLAAEYEHRESKTWGPDRLRFFADRDLRSSP